MRLTLHRAQNLHTAVGKGVVAKRSSYQVDVLTTCTAGKKSERKKGRTGHKKADPDGTCNWEDTLEIPVESLDDELTICLFTWHHVSPRREVGRFEVTVRGLLDRPHGDLLLFDHSGDVVARGDDSLPALVEVTLDLTSLPQALAVEAKAVCLERSRVPSERKIAATAAAAAAAASAGELDPQQPPPPVSAFAKHLMVFTRGTRGDVQPFLALARGLAELHNWRITVVTEVRYKEFVMSQAKVSRGHVDWRPSGGDTMRRVDSKLGKWAIQLQSDTMQKIMLARSEREFFSSEPAMFHWASTMRPDLLMFGFTMASVAMIISEALKIPLMGFVLQPTSIPSKAYPPILPLDEEAFDHLTEESDLRRHTDFNWVKGLMENSPFTGHLNALRKRRGLVPIRRSDPNKNTLTEFRGKFGANTWMDLRDKNFPLVVPINETMFGGKPDDWSSRSIFTDNIFLRGATVGQLAPEHVAFVERAKAEGGKLVALAFSSMPVSRDAIMEISLKMVALCKQRVCVFALIGNHVNDDFDPESALSKRVDEAVAQGRLLVATGAPFGRLFPLMDTIVAHGGLGTTAEAIASKVPVIVTGVLLLDQRFWGSRCHALKIGPFPVHIKKFLGKCVESLDLALEPGSEWQVNAKVVGQRLLDEAAEDPSGVVRNAQAVVDLAEEAFPYFYERPKGNDNIILDVGSAVKGAGKTMGKTVAKDTKLIASATARLLPMPKGGIHRTSSGNGKGNGNDHSLASTSLGDGDGEGEGASARMGDAEVAALHKELNDLKLTVKEQADTIQKLQTENKQLQDDKMVV